MTERRPSSTRALLAVVAAAALCAVALSRSAAARAERAFESARDSHAAVAAQARALESLRGERATVEDRPRPEPDLIARLESQLHAAGVAAESLGQVSASAARRVDNTPYRRQTCAVTIEGVSPGELARFLLAWSEAEPLWTVRGLRVQHQARAGATADLFTARLTLENIHIAP